MHRMTNEHDLPWFLTHSDPEELYRNGSFLCLDFETDGEDFGSALNENNDLVLACWQIVKPDGSVIKKQKFGNIYEQSELLDDIKTVDFIVAQNLKFELQWLKRCGADLHDILGYDTLLGAWVLDGNRKRPRDLNSLAKRYGLRGKVDIVAKLIAMGISVRDIHPAWLEEYCHQDVEVTKQVFFKQMDELSAARQWHLIHVRNMCCSVLADIEFEGLDLDKQEVDKEYVRASSLLDKLGAELATMTGGINLGSPKQLGEYLYDTLKFDEAKDFKGKPIRTKGGARATDAKTLPKLKAVTQEQKDFLRLYKDYNKAVSLVEKNLDYFRLTCEQKGGKFYGLLRQAVVQTHRLASSGIPVLFKGLKKTKSVQLQNIPREYKKLFWSGDEDWLIFEADSGQLEFRVAVEMGQDEVGFNEIETGVDVHSVTAQVLTKAGEPTTRQDAKASTFKPLYGGGKGTPAVEAYCEFFRDKYKGISGTQRTWALRCVNDGQYTTPYGMTFYFPDTKVQRSGYITNTTSIYNYPVQGYATGEIIPIALIYFWHRTRGKNIRAFLTIHDSIVSRVHKDSVQEAQEIATKALTSDVYEFLNRVYKTNFKVPLGLGMKVSRNWGATKEEIKMDVWPDGRMEDRT